MLQEWSEGNWGASKSRKSGLDDPQLFGLKDRLRAVACAELAEDARHMVLDRAFSNDERRDDLLVAGSPADETQDLQLALGEGLGQCDL